MKSTSVPVDVTVLDGSGRPVLGLTRDDFEILEDGTPQKIDLFLAPTGPETRPDTEAEPTPSGGAQAPQTPGEPRYFLILLGNMGYDVFHSLEELADFVETLGPRDRVALMAFRRLGNLSGDHQKTAQAIRRYRRVNRKINATLRHIRRLPLFLWNSPPSRNLPPTVRKTVMEFFEEAGFSSRELPLETPELEWVDLEQSASDRLRQIHSAAAASLEFRGPEDSRLQGDLFEIRELFPTNPFDEARMRLISDMSPLRAGASSDVGKLDVSQIITAINNLSHLHGDKHLLFFNDRGLDVTSSDALERIGRFAASARVRLHMFQTGGIEPWSSLEDFLNTAPGRRRSNFRRGFAGGTLTSGLALSALRILAHESGGTVSIHRRVKGSLESALAIIYSSYRLAYTPSNAEWDGKFREIEVRVKGGKGRPLHRRGYVGAPAPSEAEQLESLVLNRTVGAMKQPDHLTDIPLVLAVARESQSPEVSEFEVRLEARIPPVVFHEGPGTRQTQLTLAYFVVKDRRVGAVRDILRLSLDEADYQSALEDGFHFKRRLAVPGDMADGILKVVVFQPEKDLLGSIDMRLP